MGNDAHHDSTVHSLELDELRAEVEELESLIEQSRQAMARSRALIQGAQDNRAADEALRRRDLPAAAD